MSNLLNRFFRKFAFFVYHHFKKETIVISNNTSKKLFLERNHGDFNRKKAIIIPPRTTMTLVVSFSKGNILILRDINKQIHRILKPIFQVEVVHGDEPGTYIVNKFD